MKILRLEAENIKKLKVVEITPDGNVVEITGKNGSGKSSCLDAIFWALAGATHIQAVPIRKGATEARIHLDLGEIKVTRRFKQKDDGEGEVTTSIIVEAENGARFPSPQKVLDGLLGALSFDPLAFTRMTPKEQFDALKGFVPGVDFAAIDAENAADYAARTAVNKRAKDMRAAAAVHIVPDGTPKEPISEEGLIDELQRVGAVNTAIMKEDERRKSDRTRKARLNEEFAATLREIEKLQAHTVLLTNELKALESDIADELPLPPLADAQVIRVKLSEAQAINRHVSARLAREDKIRLAEGLEKESRELTDSMLERANQRSAAIAAAKMPVPGISFGDGEVLLNGVPFEQASTAEQLRTSIAIAMANNPKLRVIRVRDGSVLDRDSMQALADAAKANDFQVWIEMVESERPTAIHIEDGTVVKTGEKA